MKHYSTYIYLLLFSLAGVLTSCQEDMETFDNKMFTSSKIDKQNTLWVKGSQESIEKSIYAELAMPSDSKINLTYKGDLSLVEQYNTIYNEQAKALPAENFEIPEPAAFIEAGSLKSTEVKIIFKDLKALDFEQTYVLPVSIDKSDIGVLASSRTTYYIIKGAALINTVANITKNKISVKWDWADVNVLSNLSVMTTEALIRVDKFGKMISTIIGVEDRFLIRFGDLGLLDNQIQVATSAGNVTDPEWVVNPGEWTHVAVTYDASSQAVDCYLNGVKKGNTQNLNYSISVGWGSEDFYIGYSYADDRYLEGCISECRIWSRVLSEEELNEKDHFYSVEPTAEGLVSYWKFDEGEGVAIKDHSIYGNDAIAASPITWNAIELPVK